LKQPSRVLPAEVSVFQRGDARLVQSPRYLVFPENSSA
jgi:hypothetical protein